MRSVRVSRKRSHLWASGILYREDAVHLGENDRGSAMTSQSNEESQVRELYRHLLEAWNQRDASAFTALYAEDGNQIGRSLR